jgi:CheY-like chemotaxis protein
LLVDDEAVCADVGHAILTRLGYEVVVATQSHEAWVAFQAAPQCFVVLITDYCMPGWTGLELAAACRQLRADLPIILCTGASPTVYARQAAAQGIDAVLPKPFPPAELSRTLQQVLTRREASSPP